MTGEVLTPTIPITTQDGSRHWCDGAWVGKLKKAMAVERMEDRIAWELGYNVCTKFLGDDMRLLSGLSNEKVQEIITMETTTGNTLFYSLEKWRPGCRTKNRTVWLQVWGFPIEAWELKHLKTVVSMVGDVIEPNDDTEDRRRLDRARLLIRTPLPPTIRKEVNVCVDGIMHKVWMVEEVGGEGGSNPRRPSLSDAWSEEVTSEEGESKDDADDDSDSRFSFSPELTSGKPIPGSNH